MDSRLGDLARVVEEARKLGARASEAFHEGWTGVRLAVQRGKVVEEQPVAHAELTVRCWLEGGREGEATGRLEQARATIERALEAAAKAPEDPLAGPIVRPQPVTTGLGIDDRRYGMVERDDRLEVVTTAERSVRQTDRRLTPEGFRYEDRRRLRTYVSSRNVTLEEPDTTYVAEGAVQAMYDGDEIRLDGTIEARTFASISSIPYGTNVARRAAGLLAKGDKLEGEVLVMMPPLAVSRIFARLAESFRYEVLEHGPFFLRPRADGKPILDAHVHLVDDGLQPGGYRTRSFDDRGALPVPLTLLREGRPDGRVVDQTTARRLEARPTGHFTRGHLVPSNLALRTGTRSMNAIFTERNTWTFLLDDLPDLSGLDPATGDLDVRVHGQVMRSNESKGAMRNVRLRGNLIRVFNQLEDIASDTDRYGHVDAPGMLVGGFTLGG